VHGALVVSELFPPAVGGSAELFRNVYGRFGDVPVTVLTEQADGAPDRIDRMTIVREPMRARYWGVLRPGGLRHHWRRARRVKSLSGGAPTVVHSARALPEGVDAWMARRLGGSAYLCWAHGEDIASANLSREFAMLQQRVFAGAAGVIANSHNTAAMLRSLDASWSHIDVVHPGVDPERFRPDVPGAAALRDRLREGAELLLLSVGRLQRRKGHDLMIKALAALGPEAGRVRYVIAGGGEERATLETLARDLRVADRVRFAGVVPDADLPGYYAASDIFVHPNRVDGEDIEGFGIVFLEAAAAGLPVVGGDSGGVPEAVARDETGILVSGTDVEELRQALLRLMNSPDLRRAMGAAGRRRVQETFSWHRAAARVMDLHGRATQSAHTS
jgi:phosphatidylinositol alpha-1,6-mannosyltransferase